MNRTDLWQMYTMCKRNARVWLALGKLEFAIQCTHDALFALRCLRRLGDNRTWSLK